MEAHARTFRDKAERLRVTARSCRRGEVSRDYLKIAEEYDSLAAVLEWHATAEHTAVALRRQH